jgi:hypothetical protein
VFIVGKSLVVMQMKRDGKYHALKNAQISIMNQKEKEESVYNVGLNLNVLKVQ